MADPFTNVSVSDYNTNPPADDGSAVSSNEITWAKHKTKLADPLKTAIESLNTNVGAAVDKLAGGITSVSDNYTVLATDQGKLVVQTGADKTNTLPAAATVEAPFRVAFLNAGTGYLTLDGNGSETIDGETTITLGPGQGCVLDTDGSNWRSHGRSPVIPEAMFPPTGRLTLTSGVPVLTSSVTGATTIYFTPYNGNTVMLPDANGNWKAHKFAELSQTLSDTTKSPAATLADNNYDLFVWDDSGTIRCTRGPAWDADTSRGSGKDITRLDGVYVNGSAITNGPGASRGVYVGTIRTNGSNQVDMMIGSPTAASGGTANLLYVWNMYNRVEMAAQCRDSDNTWNYSTATYRSSNNSASNRISMVRGVDEDMVSAEFYTHAFNNTSGTKFTCAIGLDSTSAKATDCVPGVSSFLSLSTRKGFSSRYRGLPGLGLHYLQALEYASGGGTTIWYGDEATPTILQQTLMATLRA